MSLQLCYQCDIRLYVAPRFFNNKYQGIYFAYSWRLRAGAVLCLNKRKGGPMFRKQIAFVLSLALLVLGFALPVLACDEDHGSKVTVQAPIESRDCDGNPATLKILGLQIDISAIYFEKLGAQVQCENPTCNDLEMGQVIKIQLASDMPQNDLFTATELEVKGEDDVKVAAPLQAINGTTITVLGLTVDIAAAVLLNDEEESITAEKLLVGQFAKLVLDSSKLPSLVATKLIVHVDEIKVQAPIEAVDCDTATMKLLGLQIDISAINFEKLRTQVQCENPTCADLEKGQMVKMDLASDVPDPETGLLTATELKLVSYCEDIVKITAPLQTNDVSETNVAVLGLPIDIGEATLVDDNGQPISADKLMVGQFVEINLVSNIAPLSATKVEAHSPISQVEIKLVNKKKRPVTRGANVRAEVTVKGVKRALSIQSVGDGTFLLAGLPRGRAKIVVTCTQDGQASKGSASLKVKTRQFQQVTVRLKPVA